ncbi:MAG TPA: phosphatase PAP2 family protein [Gemmatimonadales bacterium]|nr:phosphatase PAP2 family protein [Gemmatimonadales bacterium]
MSDAKQSPLVLLVACYPIVGAVVAERLRARVSYAAAWRATVTRKALLRLAAGAVGAQVFFAAFMAWKAHLPAWGHWWADPLLADLDARLHGGDAWRLFTPFGEPGLRLLDFVYHLWLPGLALMIGWRAWAGDVRFFTAFTIAWIAMGTGIALLLHSAGPVFYEQVTGLPRYAPLLARLDSLPLQTNAGRHILWAVYASDQPSSISAFPSLHVAMPTLYALCCPIAWLRRLLWVFMTLVAAGTVALGWHYAVDAYAGILGAVACWWIAGRVVGGSTGSAVPDRAAGAKAPVIA